MRAQLERRLTQLKAEFAEFDEGQKMLAELEAKEANHGESDVLQGGGYLAIEKCVA